MKFETRNLRELPKLRDGLGYLYFEHGRIEQQDQSIALIKPPPDDAEAGEVVCVPCAALGVLMLGPGTTITHAAVKALADNGCSALWLGEEGQRFYAQGGGETRSSARLLKQVAAMATPQRHLAIVTRLYRMRFAEKLPEHLTLQQLRGREGARVRDAYAQWSKATGVEWNGRNYDRGSWQASDPVNRALSAANSCLYGLAHAGIVSLGFSPALGFIHTGKQLSFVYDVADLYKLETVVPAAFATVAQSDGQVETRVRKALRERCHGIGLLDRISKDLLGLFDIDESDGDAWSTDPAAPGALWDGDANVEGGKSYGTPQAAADARPWESEEPPF